MSLIQCDDCGNPISDSARAFPQCGAPVPVSIGVDQKQCPFCMIVLRKDASICSGCHSMKGHATNAYGVMGRKSVIGFGIVLPILITLVFLPASIVCVLLPLFCAGRVKRGPAWYHRKSPA